MSAMRWQGKSQEVSSFAALPAALPVAKFQHPDVTMKSRTLLRGTRSRKWMPSARAVEAHDSPVALQPCWSLDSRSCVSPEKPHTQDRSSPLWLTGSLAKFPMIPLCRTSLEEPVPSIESARNHSSTVGSRRRGSCSCLARPLTHTNTVSCPVPPPPGPRATEGVAG